MTTLETSPHYDSDALAAMSESELIDRLIQDEDRAPRNVIDECAQRGEAMVAHLREVLARGRAWKIESEEEDNRGEDDDDIDGKSENTNGDWWLVHHAVMILGLIPSETAGLLLVDYMRRIDEEIDEDLQDWLSGRWPALYLNKPASVLPVLRALCEDQALEWYVRHDAVESVLALAHSDGQAALDAALDWAANLAADKQEDWDLRMLTGNTLLSFAPARHRGLLDTLAAEQSGLSAVFLAAQVTGVYTAGGDKKPWEAFADPWEFYSPDTIEKRQQHWADIDAPDVALRTDGSPPVTYVRDNPKIGRNDPCPCGSGKKYKKCCMET
jgi:SEC-C motif